MARQRKLSPERKAFINSLIEHYHPEDAADVQEMLVIVNKKVPKMSEKIPHLFLLSVGLPHR